MAIDMEAIRAKLAATKAAIQVKESVNVKETVAESSVPSNGTSVAIVNSTPVSKPDAPVPAVVLTSTDVIGTAKTSEIDHLDFLNKMNMLQEAIHKQHPTMPVLLMQIHKQLRADPELTSTLSEEGIGVIVKGLQIQTKTELVSVVVKESKSKKKKEPISLDMF